ncbi:hypothetical protein LIER_27602 [Lithospermum erythrorhizon]|uniref:Transmembrane protein 53 n=1 Tax=Lithospermum erythrorhizon TaxID=34254 RepID=A0AAV3RG86_LITER
MESSIRLLHSSPLLHHPLRRTFKIPPPSSASFRHLLISPRQFPNQIPNSNQNPNYSPNFQITNNQFAHILSSPNRPPFSWNYSTKSPQSQPKFPPKVNSPVITAVLLGWLGSKQKHLRRYLELYNSRGVHAVTFVAGVGDVLSFDLGKKLEERIGSLASELANWVSGEEEDGRQRVLMFHTFSNTGWLAYGAILDNFRGREDLLRKIKGCVVDSGGDPNIDPKVWAAGFTAALLKKRSSSASTSFEPGGENQEGSAPESIEKEEERLLIETMLLSAFEKFFSFLLNLPNINRRLMKVIRALKDQPPCPQLYLYSTADKVIPYKSVESFISEQSRGGRKVWSHNFVSSPHVDHYRTYPDVYASELETFLEECVGGRKHQV